MVVLDRQECQALCDATSYCSAWTFNKDFFTCGMKERNGWSVVEVVITEPTIKISVGHLLSNKATLNISIIFLEKYLTQTRTLHSPPVSKTRGRFTKKIKTWLAGAISALVWRQNVP